MNRLNFEDTVFILNMRIRMIKDTLHLGPPPELFLEKSLDDLVFIDSILDMLTGTLAENERQFSDYISDSEWQFSQLLTEFSLESSPFLSQTFGDTMRRVASLRESSDTRRKSLEGTSLSLEMAQSEPVVTSAELNGLLGGI